MNERRLDGMAGFTLVELLAVIAIIVLLAAGLVVSVGYFAKRGTATRTSSILMLVEQGIVSFHDDFNVYPPEYRKSYNAYFFAHEHNTPDGNPNPFNRQLSDGTWYEPEYRFAGTGEIEFDSDYDYSSELLYQFLVKRFDDNDPNQHTKQFLPRKSAYLELPEYAVRDVDNDGKIEIVDAWGNPILYVAKDLYGDLSTPEQEDQDGNIEPHLDKNENSFSLYSYGNDGLGLYDGPLHYRIEHKSDDIDDYNDMLNAIKKKYPKPQNNEAIQKEKANRDNVTKW
ncbi:unnamed protein product [marine sediment metagenome]|uniref:Type II secretion system protein GspG C-terminal domain-containing protein n=1 Tax=marine sediment metagenome TaxID=412755 RepID=X0SHI0_9ZZZZ